MKIITFYPGYRIGEKRNLIPTLVIDVRHAAAMGLICCGMVANAEVNNEFVELEEKRNV